MGLCVSTAREIAGTSASAVMTTWYLLQNRGDTIGFVSDYDQVWPLAEGSWEESKNYKEVTEEVIASLVKAEILEDHGTVPIGGDPELLERVLEVVWGKT